MTFGQTKKHPTNHHLIVILGMHRSGTSALAGACKLLGAELGRDLMPPGDDNPNGFWENRLVYEFNERLLRHLGVAWDYPGPLPSTGWDDEVLQPFYLEAQKLLDEQFGSSDFIAIKDPRICRLLPFWQGVWQQLGWSPCYLFCMRDPVEVSASLLQRNDIKLPHASLLWLRHHCDAEWHTRNRPRALVTFESLLQGWRETLSCAWEQMGLEWKQPGQSVQSSIDTFLQPSLRHHNERSNYAKTGGLTLAQGIYVDINRDPDDEARIRHFDNPVLPQVDRTLDALMAGGLEQCEWPVWAAAFEAATQIEEHSRKDIQRLKQDAGEQARETRAFQQQLEEQSREAKTLQVRLEEMQASRSWRITKPLRAASSEIDWLKRNRKMLIRWSLKRVWRTVPLPPKLRRYVVLIFCRYAPGLMQDTSLYAMYRATPTPIGEVQGENEMAPEAPSPTHWPTVGSHPAVSVIIPVHNNWYLTSACLESIRHHGACQPFEVVVVDDASTDETALELNACDDVVFVRNEKNLGFIGASNRGAKVANGEFIVFLNNDTEVHAGWLDFMFQTFRDIPEAGLVGAKLLYPDGKLQEAGGIVWEDASGWNYGHNCDANHPAYNYMRDVDYCSGACLMIHRDLFMELDGFDSYYAPAYYEDTDLAFRVREAGWRVLYQPLSRITHYEGVSHGTEESGGVKRHQAINRKRFLKRWERTLASHGTPAEDFSLNRQRTMRGRVLVIDSVTPTPDRDSGSVDAFNLMRILTELSLQVSFIPEDNLAYINGYTNALQAQGVECWYFPYLNSVKDHLREYGSRYDVVILSRLAPARNHMETARRYCQQAKIVFNTVDLHFLREMRKSELESSASQKFLAENTKRQEISIMEAADLTLVISPVERELLLQERPHLEVAELPLILEDGEGSITHFAQRCDLFFLGGFQHPPNVDAVQWFLAEVWPEVRRRLPAGVRLHIIGSQMPEEIKALTDDGIVVAGYVPDVNSYIEGMRLSVAPLRYGAGLKGKIARSLKHGIPCVASDIAGEGMSGETGNGIVTATTPDEYAARISELYSDEQRWRSASQEAREYFEEHYSYAAGVNAVKTILKRLKPQVLVSNELH